MSATVIFGIPNCDTMKKARRWLDAQHIEHRFHNYKRDGIDSDQLSRWCAELGWESLLNRRGTTWRKLDAATRDNIDESQALQLMQTQTSLIKRPVLQHGNTVLVGFDEPRWQALLGS